MSSMLSYISLNSVIPKSLHEDGPCKFPSSQCPLCRLPTCRARSETEEKYQSPKTAKSCSPGHWKAPVTRQGLEIHQQRLVKAKTCLKRDTNLNLLVPLLQLHFWRFLEVHDLVFKRFLCITPRFHFWSSYTVSCQMRSNDYFIITELSF